MSTPTYPDRPVFSPQPDSAGALAGLHFGLHWALGMALMAVAVAVLVLLDASTKTSAQGFVIFGGYIFGIPAGVVGLLRIPLMAWLFRRARAWPAQQPGRLARLLAETAAVFLGPVVVLLLLYKIKTGDSLAQASSFATGGVIFYFTVSLPWLLGAVGAAWALRRKLWPATASPTAAGPTGPTATITPTTADRAQPADFGHPAHPRPAA